MKKVPFFLGVFLLIFPLNWFRLLALGEMPPGNDVRLVLLLTLLVLIIATALIWFGLPSVRQSYAAIAEVPTNDGNPLMRLGAAIKDAYNESVQRKLEEKKRLELELEHARTGTLIPIDPGMAILQKGEEAFASIDAAMLELQTVGYRGRSSGVSVRVARGVWLRQSGSRGTPEKGLVAVAHGMLVATNRRLIFAGDQKSVAVQLEKMSSFEPMKDGLRFGDGRKTFNFLMGQSQQQQVFALVASRLVRDRSRSGAT